MKQSELMADEGYYYESRFGCKLCSKRFPCGKSLGAHTRSHHVAPNYSAESDEKKINGAPFEDFVQESGGDSKMINYALRENPKKTWRAEISSRIPPPSPSPLQQPQGRICKQCGKGFQSMKALCGHMACHSEKDKNVKDDGSWTSENQKASLEYSCSDSEEAEAKRMRTRSSASKNKRYKKIVEKSPLFLLNSDNDKVNLNHGSSSVSEIDWEDQEEVAMCLMMLSRDFVNSSNNNNTSVVESSDNNSVVLETNKSSSIEKRSGMNEQLKGKQSNLEVESDSDSGYFLDECAKADSCLSVDGFRRYSAYFGDLRNGSSVKDRVHGEYQDESRKYECFNCKKTFKSYQALGGHRPCHKRTAVAFYEPRYESGEHSLDDSTDYNRKKQSAKKNKATVITTTTTVKGKSHVCPFCDRVFKNGQALGGHKRSHFIGGGNLESGIHSRPKDRDLLDLNLPAPEADGF